MSKTKKYIVVFIVILVIILLITLIMRQKPKKDMSSEDRVLNVYNNILNKEEYSFRMEEKNEEIEYNLLMCKKGDDYSIDTQLDDEHTTTLVLNNQVYYIMHDEQEYYPLEADDEFVDLESDVYIIENGLKEITKNEYTKGNEEINGKSYYYEEYNNESLDFILFADINETSSVKTRFYFDGEDLVFIKNFITSEEEETEELINVNLTYEADDNLFKIPEDYAEAQD